MGVWVIFLFHGSINLVKLSLGETTRLGLDVFLCLAFFIQHSIMIRSSFRRWLKKFIRTDYHGAVFAISSGLVLLALVVLWQGSPHTLAASQGILRWFMHAVFFLSILGVIWGTWALGLFDAFGVRPILSSLRGKEPPPAIPFTIRGPYRWVRHPLYFFCLLMIWSIPDLTVDRLLYNILWTGWIIVGSMLEERDLIYSFGEEYRDYQKKVPMLIPRSIRPAQK